MIKRLKLSKMKTMDYVVGNLISGLLSGVHSGNYNAFVFVLVGFKWEGGIYTASGMYL